MLAIFDKSVAKSPEGLQTLESNSVSALKDGFLPQPFSPVYPGSVTINLGPSGVLAYSLNQQNFFLPRLFAIVDDIFCLFQGHLDNVVNLKRQYGLNETANEVIIVIEAYRTLRDRGPYSAAQVVRDFQETVTKSCGISSAPFPKGCFFTTSGGLRIFEHPLNELKLVPRVDSFGQVCGATFKVDADVKKEPTGMPRVGNAVTGTGKTIAYLAPIIISYILSICYF